MGPTSVDRFAATWWHYGQRVATSADADDTTGPTNVTLTGSSARRLHLTAACGISVCLAALVVETWRAVDGNGLSWVYVVEWPVLGGFGAYMWWRIYHGYDRLPRASSPARSAATATPRTSPTDTAANERLDAWQAYLAQLEADDRDHEER